MRYHHLTLTERELLAQLAAAGKDLQRIAEALRRHPTTIGRELRRNALILGEGQGRLYLAGEAQQLSRHRRRQAPRARKLDHQPLRREVERRLRQTHSPEQIAATLVQEHPQDPRMHLSHETIYGHVQRDYLGGGSLYRQLLQHGPKRRPRCRQRRRRLPLGQSIHHRPQAAEERSEVGHWESDTMVGKNARIVTHVERTSGYLIARKIPDGTSRQLNRATIRAFKLLPDHLRRSLTSDNGSEFAGHEALTRNLGLAVYFADPHSPWQRGLNENTNGLLRQFFPKGSDFAVLSRQRLAYAVKLINTRPRKRLNYQTPENVLLKHRSEPSTPALQI